VLPYLAGLSKMGYQFVVLSFEKKGRYQKEKKDLYQFDFVTTGNFLNLFLLFFIPPFFFKA